MDRNQIIGFSLLAVLLMAYIGYNQYEQKQYLEKKQADSIAYAKTHPPKKVDTAAAKPPVVDDSATAAMKAALPPALNGTEQSVKLENNKVALTFTTKGAYPTSAELKEYKTYYKKPLYLFNGKGNHLTATLPYDNARSTETLYFTPTERTESDGTKVVDFVSDLGNGKKVDIIYSLAPNEYMMHCKMLISGMPASNLKLNWQTQGLTTEKDIINERMNTQVYYRFKDGDNDYFTVRNNELKNEHSDNNTAWVGYRKQYFSSVLMADDAFSKMDIKAIINTADSHVVAQNAVDLVLPLNMAGTEASAGFKWYVGPNDYKVLKSYKASLEDMVPLGYGIMSFVKYINKGVLIPLFYFLASFISNYALIIVLLTVFIRLVLSFFTYKSYLSSAKMRVLKPELDELRAKFGDDQQKMSMEQMKLYREAGVNPLGGCLPMLFQLPILLSMYYMFPSFIEFRQKSFLWADDLSTFDSILNFGFNVPFYGDHISLFTLLMTASSLFLAIYNRNMTPQDPNNPMMKYMPFIFPIVLMGVFNKMAAALTFYYTFSNILSIAQQFIIQKYFIDEKAIHAKILENRNKPAAPSKWQQKLDEMQKMQAERSKNLPRKNS